MADDNMPSDSKTSAEKPEEDKVRAGKSPQDELLSKLPGASPPADNEAEGEGDGTLDEK